MGILDDAIREHLELKRAHGAASDDLERLENEAFGPAARPGDPEFDTSEEPAEGTAPDSEAETRVESASAPAPAAPDTGEEESEVPGIFDVEAGPETKEEDWLASLEDVVEAPATEQPAAPARAPEPEPEPESMEQPEAPAPDSPPTGEADEVSPAERARHEHPDLGDTIPHDAVPDPAEQAPATDEAEAAPEARAAGAARVGDLRGR